MNCIELILIGLGLAMDAFAVAVCKGTACNKIIFINCFKIGLCFGLFQAIMPFVGYWLGNEIKGIVLAIDHYIVFCLLVIIGSNMIYDSLVNKEENYDSYFNLVSLLGPALATSIDAFSVGITFALYKVNIFKAIIIIGVITFILSFLGVILGSSLSKRWDRKAKVFGGIVLIILGIKLLLEHLL